MSPSDFRSFIAPRVKTWKDLIASMATNGKAESLRLHLAACTTYEIHRHGYLRGLFTSMDKHLADSEITLRDYKYQEWADRRLADRVAARTSRARAFLRKALRALDKAVETATGAYQHQPSEHAELGNRSG